MVRRRTGFDWPPRRDGARTRRVARVAISLIGGLAGFAALGAALLWLRLAEGPVDLARFLPRLISAVEAELGPGRVRVGGMALALGAHGDPAPALRLTDVHLRDAAGRSVLVAPVVSIFVRPLDLLAGRMRPAALSIDDARLLLRREAGGRFVIDLDAPDREPDAGAVASDPADMATPGDHGVAPPGEGSAGFAAIASWAAPLEGLREIALPRLRLIYSDAASGRMASLGRADLRMTRMQGALAASATLEPPGGGTVAVRGTIDGDGLAAFRLDVASIAPQALSALAPGLGALAALDAPLSGFAEMTVGAEGRLAQLAGRFSLAEGRLRLGPGGAAIEHAAADFRWSPDAARIDLDRLSLRGPLGAAVLSGAAHYTDGGGATLDLRLERLEIGDPALLAAPAVFDAGSILARVTVEPLAVELAALHLRRGALQLDARGTAARSPDGWGGEVSIVGRDIAASDLAELWPVTVAEGARSWVAANLSAGHVDRADLFARAGAQGADLDLTFAFRDGAAHYLRPLPPIEKAAGWGRLTGDRFDLALTGGVVRSPGGGAVDLAGSSMAVPDLSDPLSTAAIAVTGAGPVSAILEVLDMEPLGFVSALGLEARAVTGQARAQAALTVPLVHDVRLEQVGVSATADLADVDLIAPGVNARVTARRLDLAADTRRLTLSGDITLAGAPVALALTETFAPDPGAPRTALRIIGPVTVEQSAAIGAPLGERVSGVANADARLAVGVDGALDFDVALDLRGTAVDGAPLPWSKPPAAAGRARLVGRSDRDGVAFTRIDADSAGLVARGSASLSPKGALSGAALDMLRIEGVMDAAVDLSAERGVWRASLRGPFLDLGALRGRDAEEADADAGPAPFSLDAEIGDLRVTERLALSDARLSASRDPPGDMLARIDGVLGGRSAAFLGYADSGGSRRLRFAADDAGEALRALGVFRRGLGGMLEADVAAPSDGAWSGELRIAGLSVSDDPGLAAMLERADLPEARETMRREGLRFDTVLAPFAIEGDRLRFDEAVAYGPSIGLTVSGTVDTVTDMLDLEGVFTPAYGVNRLLGDLPVIGPLFSGGAGQGLIGFTFTMTGPSAEPRVSVNALSGLLPGALRRLARPQSEENAVRSREAWLERLEQMR